MDRKFFKILINVLTAFALQSVVADAELTHQQILERIVEKAKQNQELSQEIGFHQKVATTKLRDGKVSETKVKTFRATWIDDQPYLELIQVNGQELSEKERREEKERKVKFVKSLKKKQEADDDEIDAMAWEDLYAKYDFHPLPSDSIGHYVYSFRPKAAKLKQRSRTEKVMNHVTGTFWADEHFNLIKAEARLLDNVRFGLGILGNLEKLELTYGQKNFERIHVPAYFSLHFKARIALLKTEERKIEGIYTDYFYRESASGGK